MAVTSKMFLRCPYNMMKKLINDLSSTSTTIKCALLSSSAVISQTTNDSYNDLKSYEITGTGYTAGGAEITNKTVTVDTSNKYVIFDGDDVQWTNSTITARYLICYDATPTIDSDKKLLFYMDFGEDKSTEGGTFKIEWDAVGIFRFVIS